MFALLITQYKYQSSDTQQKLYHRIFESERAAYEAAQSLARSTARRQEEMNIFKEDCQKFTHVDHSFEIPHVEDRFDAAVIFVDGKDGVDSINDATIHVVSTYKVVEFTDPDKDGGLVLTR